MKWSLSLISDESLSRSKEGSRGQQMSPELLWIKRFQRNPHNAHLENPTKSLTSCFQHINQVCTIQEGGTCPTCCHANLQYLTMKMCFFFFAGWGFSTAGSYLPSYPVYLLNELIEQVQVDEAYNNRSNISYNTCILAIFWGCNIL